MTILLASIFLGMIGLAIGSLFGADIFTIVFALIGFSFPPFFILEKIYNKICKSTK
ncbi:MAG: hypothetical protein RSD22_06160 [Romboutsia sp.]